MLEAVIFDLDGTLVDSEQQGHRPAFNAAFEAFGLPDRWSPERYRDLLTTTGGERRLYVWLSSPESSCSDRPEEERRRLAKALHQWKTERFATLAVAGEIPPRDGVRAWLDELGHRGVRLAVATTGSRQWAVPLVDKLFGPDRFETIVAGDEVTHRKPDPEAYLMALDRLALPPGVVVAVEDSGPGWESAHAAGLTCVVVANDETDRASVADAVLILDQFVPDPYTVLADALANTASTSTGPARGKMDT